MFATYCLFDFNHRGGGNVTWFIDHLFLKFWGCGKQCGPAWGGVRFITVVLARHASAKNMRGLRTCQSFRH